MNSEIQTYISKRYPIYLFALNPELGFKFICISQNNCDLNETDIYFSLP
jgi:hypothetical protein